ncbi:MAG TPA: hypothetical protein VFI37_04335 [Gaiellaceae bacterium]|jgi:predicted N-acetyltransferase YhbS|nr:hypothetical protein [Gaiellaceae bacterium]
MSDHRPLVRPATGADAAAVDRVHRAAFAGEEEARLAREVPAEISLVAEEGGEVVGHVLVSRARVDEAPGLYYPHFGFRPARALGIEPPFDVSDEVWMALPLSAYDPGLKGRFCYHRGFG